MVIISMIIKDPNLKVSMMRTATERYNEQFSKYLCRVTKGFISIVGVVGKRFDI